MLRVTVEIWPDGDQTRAHAIATANIGNLSYLADVSDYAIQVNEAYNPMADTPRWSQRGHIYRHDRRASVWALVAKVAHWASEEAGKNSG